MRNAKEKERKDIQNFTNSKQHRKIYFSVNSLIKAASVTKSL